MYQFIGVLTTTLNQMANGHISITSIIFIGGIVIFSGIAINMILKKSEIRRTEKRQKYWSEIKRMEDAHRAHLMEIYLNEKNNRD